MGTLPFFHSKDLSFKKNESFSLFFKPQNTIPSNCQMENNAFSYSIFSLKTSENDAFVSYHGSY